MGTKLKIDLIGSMNTRGVSPNESAPTTDQLFENCLFYPIQNPYTGNKSIYVGRRRGIPSSGTTDSDYTSIEGFYHWKALGTTCRYGYSQVVFTYTPKMTVVDSTGTNAVQSGSTSFPMIFHVSETYNSSGTPCIIWIGSDFLDNKYTTMYLWADGDAAQTSITVPTGSCGHPVHADGYTFVGNKDGKIYNSPLNNPAGTYTDYIDTGMSPDKLVTLWKQGQILWALGTHSLEAFEIIANTTGSPLRRIPKLFSNVGIFKNISWFSWGSFTSRPPPIADFGDTAYFLGQTNQGIGVYKLDRGGIPEKISGSIQDKYLQRYRCAGNGANSGFKTIKIGSKKLLLIYVTNNWLCYDTELEYWSIWSSTKVGFDHWYNQHNGDGLIFSVDNVYYTWNTNSSVPYLDVDATITRNIITSKINFGTNKYKRVNALSVIGDRQTTTSNLSVSFSGDDYANFSTARTIDMSTAHPFLSGFGMNRDWIFKLSDTVEREQRLEAIELDYDVMEQ